MELFFKKLGFKGRERISQRINIASLIHKFHPPLNCTHGYYELWRNVQLTMNWPYRQSLLALIVIQNKQWPMEITSQIKIKGEASGRFKFPNGFSRNCGTREGTRFDSRLPTGIWDCLHLPGAPVFAAGPRRGPTLN